MRVRTIWCDSKPRILLNRLQGASRSKAGRTELFILGGLWTAGISTGIYIYFRNRRMIYIRHPYLADAIDRAKHSPKLTSVLGDPVVTVGGMEATVDSLLPFAKAHVDLQGPRGKAKVYICAHRQDDDHFALGGKEQETSHHVDILDSDRSFRTLPYRIKIRLRSMLQTAFSCLASSTDNTIFHANNNNNPIFSTLPERTAYSANELQQYISQKPKWTVDNIFCLVSENDNHLILSNTISNTSFILNSNIIRINRILNSFIDNIIHRNLLPKERIQQHLIIDFDDITYGNKIKSSSAEDRTTPMETTMDTAGVCEEETEPEWFVDNLSKHERFISLEGHPLVNPDIDSLICKNNVNPEVIKNREKRMKMVRFLGYVSAFLCLFTAGNRMYLSRIQNSGKQFVASFVKNHPELRRLTNNEEVTVLGTAGTLKPRIIDATVYLATTHGIYRLVVVAARTNLTSPYGVRRALFEGYGRDPVELEVSGAIK